MTTTPLPETIWMGDMPECTPKQLIAYAAAECAARDALNVKAHGEIRDLNAALAKRNAEIERLRADAARYRWLREPKWDREVVIRPREEDFAGHFTAYFGDGLDAAIDAAIAWSKT